MDASQEVFTQGGFPGVIGVIDGTHIAIRAPMNSPDDYINRKKFHSVQVQVNHRFHKCNSIITNEITG